MKGTTDSCIAWPNMRIDNMPIGVQPMTNGVFMTSQLSSDYHCTDTCKFDLK